MLLAGCASHKPVPDLPFARPDPRDALPLDPAEAYRIACPDVVEVVFAVDPAAGGRLRVLADGHIELGQAGRIRAEGLTAPELAQHIARHLRLAEHQVSVRVVEFNSQQLFLFGQVGGAERAVDYRGPETIVELLKRTGGLSPGAAVSEIHVIRSHLAEGGEPEVFPVDLKAILEKNDDRTNLRLHPQDQIYVGEMVRSKFARAVPSLLQPVYDAACALIPGSKCSMHRTTQAEIAGAPAPPNAPPR